MLRTGSSLTGTSAQRQASSTRVQVVEAEASAIGMGGGIMDRESGNTPRCQSGKSRSTSGFRRKTPGRTGRRLIPAGPRTPTMSRRFGLLVCCVLLAACSAGSAASSSPPPGVTLAGTFADDSFQASDYHGNACAIFESGTWQVQVRAGGSTTVAVVAFTDTAVADAPGSGPTGEPAYGLCTGSWSVSVPKSADYVITAVSSGDDGNSQLPGSVVVPGSYGRSGIQLGDDYGEELTG